ncbi:MAG: DUF481 domain-containing protein [Candidatus Binatia bacterium]
MLVCLQAAVATAEEVAPAAPPPPPDTVTSKGTVLRGKITAISSAGLTFEPEYGKGSIAIKWEAVEDLSTSGRFQVLYGDGEELYAPLAGFSNSTLYVGPQVEGASMIAVDTIHSGVPIGDEPSFLDRTRSYWRYWDGSLDFALNVQQATTNTTGFLLGFHTVRRNNPTRLFLDADYRYSTQEKNDEDKTTIEDRAFGAARGEYDFTPRFYGYGSGDATYDAIQKLSIRAIPKAGLGYVFWEDQLDDDRRDFLSGDVGGAWVYEKFFTQRFDNGPIQSESPENNYFAIAFGAAAAYHLPYGAKFDWRLDYLPAVDDFVNDYLLRTTGSLLLPVYGPIGAKLAITDEYDNTPAPDTQPNSLFITFGISVGW